MKPREILFLGLENPRDILRTLGIEPRNRRRQALVRNRLRADACDYLVLITSSTFLAAL